MAKTDYTKIEENLGLIHQATKSVYGRVANWNSSDQYEDVFQEMSILYLHSLSMFDPSKGLQFSTYFMCAVNNKGHNMTKLAARAPEASMVSIESAGNSADGDSYGLEEVIPSDAPTPEEILIQREKQHMASRLMAHLSPTARLIVEWLVNPPEELMREFKARQAHAQHARELGIEKRCAPQLTVDAVCNFIRMTSSQVTAPMIRRARAELADYAEE